MFELGALGEFLIIVVAVLILFRPKEIPELVRFAGRWFGKIRRMSRQIQKAMDDVIHDAEIEDFKNSANKGFEQDIKKNLEDLEKDE